jgi:hypothetical protein
MGWIAQTFCRLGKRVHVVISNTSCLDGCVLSLCSGSGSMLEACMQPGKFCIGLEIDGIFS